MSVGAARLTAPAEPESLEQVYNLFAAMWEAHEDIAIGDRVRFETAAMELANNITAYAETKEFSFELRVSRDSIVGVFRDWGKHFEIDPSAAAMPDEMAESGRGLALAFAALDELTYRRDKGENYWRLLLRRSTAG